MRESERERGREGEGERERERERERGGGGGARGGCEISNSVDYGVPTSSEVAADKQLS